jgi:hypothetical protein
MRIQILHTAVVVAFLSVLRPPVAWGDQVVVEQQGNCVADLGLHSNWVEVPLAAGTHTITLESSDFGTSPDVENHMVFVLGDSFDPASYDYRLFTLNGVGDSTTVLGSSEVSFYLGFIDAYAGDDHGTSTIHVEHGPGPARENTWGQLKAWFR